MSSEQEQPERNRAPSDGQNKQSEHTGMTPRGKYTIIVIGVAFFGILICMCLSIFALVAV